MAKRYIVTLTTEEREMLQSLISSGTERARKLTRARILLKADEGWKDKDICRALDVGIATVERVRKRFVLEGLVAALNQRRPNREYSRKLDGEQEARLIALTCGSPPEGHGGISIACRPVAVRTSSTAQMRSRESLMGSSPVAVG